jgi:hypothetical protein
MWAMALYRLNMNPGRCVQTILHKVALTASNGLLERATPPSRHPPNLREKRQQLGHHDGGAFAMWPMALPARTPATLWASRHFLALKLPWAARLEVHRALPHTPSTRRATLSKTRSGSTRLTSSITFASLPTT